MEVRPQQDPSCLQRAFHRFYLKQLLFIVSFQTELVMNTHVAISDMRHDVSEIHQNVSKIQAEIGGQLRSVSASHAIHDNRMLTAI